MCKMDQINLKWNQLFLMERLASVSHSQAELNALEKVL